MWPKKSDAYICEEPPVVHNDVFQADLDRCALVGKNFRDRYMNQCWIENDADGFTGWRWEKYNTKLRIVAAANRYKDIVVVGPRHYSNAMRLAIDALGGVKILRAYAGDEYEQGFVDQYSTFYTREEALELAKANDQVLYTDNMPTNILISEMLY